MNIYLIIVISGLLLKLYCTQRLFDRLDQQYRSIKPEVWLFISIFLLYSVSQIFLFGPENWGNAVGLSRINVLRAYFFVDGTSFILCNYLLLSMFGIRFHKHPACIVALIIIITIGFYLVILTDTMISGTHAKGIITVSLRGQYVFIGDAVILAFLVITITALYKSYVTAKSNRSQIKNVYALAAATIYGTNCLVGLFISIPLIMSVRGIIIYVIVLTILKRDHFFDIRPVAPATIERTTMRKFGRILRDYSAEDIDHRGAVERLERTLIVYKIKKISDFDEGSNSSLPQVADSMGVNLSSLYRTMSRLGIKKPPKQK